MHAIDSGEFSSITAPRLYLRRLLITDSQRFFTYRSDPLVYEYQLWRPKSVEEIHDFISSQLEIKSNTADTWYQLAVCEKCNGTMVGDCGVHFMGAGSCQVELGFTIYPPYQRRGYATEAVCALLEYLFSTLKKHRVIASVDPRNIHSVRVLEKIGMRKEAHFYKAVSAASEWTDDAVYAILASEWLSPAKAETDICK